ncbi:DNA repair protein RadA [Peptococcus simiae]|uniref:DNA repair protein RadA n=1 Tax=Peptococcus simiae TaxID=1643805 RepID=A0ABW9H095_9FIRM
MAKRKSIYVCQECGHHSPQWLGKCPGCGAWDSLVEEVPVAAPTKNQAARLTPPGLGTDRAPQAEPLSAIDSSQLARIGTGSQELDRVLGGGLVPGALILLAGDPGIGKSTLTMQLMAGVHLDGPVLYISGEESRGQIKSRANRLGADGDKIYLLTANQMDLIEDYIDRIQPKLIVLDSVQTVYDPELTSALGTVSQLRQVATRSMGWAKGRGIPTVLIGHVTKDGSVAGPRVMEHMVDAVLYFEGDRHSQYRILRAFKNRFGASHEIGLFDMTRAGLAEVPNPSAAFLAERPKNAAGSAVTATMEGNRPILLEVQALVASTVFGYPQRKTTGVDNARALMLMAVLEKRLGLALSKEDVYLNVVGGLRIGEPAADLGIALAIVSAFDNRPLPEDVLFLAEVGLTGELRRVSQLSRRLQEAAQMGFRRAVVAAGSRVDDVDIELISCNKLSQAVEKVWGVLI